VSTIESIALWLTLALGAIGAVANIAQVVIAWFTLREVGDMDHDRKDWFEKLPWRRYRRDE
jgi:hypothetical protein